MTLPKLIVTVTQVGISCDIFNKVLHFDFFSPKVVTNFCPDMQY